MEQQRDWLFDTADLDAEGDELRRRGAAPRAYIDPLRRLKAWATRDDPGSLALVTALTHHGWETGGSMPCRETDSVTCRNATAAVESGELPHECFSFGDPTGAQIVACMERLQAAGAPLGDLMDLWLCYSGGVPPRSTPSGPTTSPEVEDAKVLADEAAGRPPRSARRMSAAELKAVEVRAVAVATQHFTSLGYAVEDVGATESYDLDVRRGSERLYVEVKGTTSSGDAVVLTKNEVVLHREKYPDNALAVVRGIRLETSDRPECSGGELALFQPWLIDDDALTALSYSYVTGVAHH